MDHHHLKTSHLWASLSQEFTKAVVEYPVLAILLLLLMKMNHCYFICFEVFLHNCFYLFNLEEVLHRQFNTELDPSYLYRLLGFLSHHHILIM